MTSGSTLDVGTPLNLTGTFTLPDKTSVAGVPVHLQFQNSTGGWSNQADSTTAADGTYTLPIWLGQSTTLRVISDSSWTRLEGDSNPIAVNLTRVISWPVPSTMHRGLSYTVAGRVQPAVAGLVVSLNNPSTPSRRTPPALTTTTDAGGNFSFTINNSQPGFYSYNISTAADSSFAASSTPFVTVVVR